MRSTRPRTRTARAALLAPVAALALLLGACAGAGDDDEPTPEETSVAPEDEEDDAEPDPGASGGAGCVTGTWVSDAEAQAAATTSALGAELDATATVTGDSVTTFDGTSMTTEYRDQVVTVEWAIEGQAFVMVNSWSGTLTGTAEVTDEQIVISDVDSSGLDVAYETSINGEVVEIPGTEDIPMSGLAAGGTSTYTCSGDELRMTPVVDGVDTSGFVTILHRQ